MIKGTINTTVEDNIDEIIAKLDQLNGIEVSAGYYDSKPHPEHDDTYPNIAFNNTFGALNIPERPFMQDAGQKDIKKITKLSGDAVLSALQVKPFKDDLEKVAEQQKNNIKDTITNNSYPLNAEPYKTQKKELYGSDDPLIATGSMRDNVETRITKKEVK